MTENELALNAEIVRLNKIIQALMNRAERNTSVHGSDFNLFQRAITLEHLVQRRTGELEAARDANEKMTRNLRESENRIRLLIDNSPAGIHEIDLSGRIISMNRAGLLIMGFREEVEALGTPYLSIISDTDRERIENLMIRAYAGETAQFEYKSNGKEGQFFRSCFVPIKDKNGNTDRLMGISEEITERIKAEEQIRNFAFYDPLTQIPNRRLLTDRLRHSMACCKRSGCYGALMFMDLDNFKPLNDKYGHDVGDQLLIEAAGRISGCVRSVDTVARFGGDEFVVMLSELDGDKVQVAKITVTIAEKIRSALAKPYLLRRQDSEIKSVVEHHCTSSIGVVLYNGSEASHEDIIKWADLAMYQAKEEGRNRVRLIYNP